MRRLMISVLVVVALAGAVVAAACAPAPAPTPTPTPAPTPTPTPTPTPPPAPDKLVFGYSDTITGWATAYSQFYTTYPYSLWADEVNAEGGIYVKEYDARIPVELKLYDDRSDPSVSVKMYEKLILEDEVDFLLAPMGTAWGFAVSPLINEYGHPFISNCAYSDALVEKAAQGDLPYVFSVNPTPKMMWPSITDVFLDMGVESVAFFYLQHLMGIEYFSAGYANLTMAGISVPVIHEYPLSITDFTPLLKDAMAADVDAVVLGGYFEVQIAIEQMMVLDYNPKAIVVPDASWDPNPYVEKFGDISALEGIIGDVINVRELPFPGAVEVADNYLASFGKILGWPVFEYASGQIMGQAIEAAGTLDRDKVRDVLASDTFSTVIGDVYFGSRQVYADQPFMVGQYQDGVYRQLGPSKPWTVAPVYPKPAWPK